MSKYTYSKDVIPLHINYVKTQYNVNIIKSMLKKLSQFDIKIPLYPSDVKHLFILFVPDFGKAITTTYDREVSYGP